MAAATGSYEAAKYVDPNVSKPSTVVMACTGHSDHAAAEPPTFVAASENDQIATPAVMERRAEALRRSGMRVESPNWNLLDHGSGPGSGSSAEGGLFESIRL